MKEYIFNFRFLIFNLLDVKPKNVTLGPPTVSGSVTMVRTANHKKTGYRNETRLLKYRLWVTEGLKAL